ncbi:MAG: hypothetical protein K2N06_09005 [Oscillospiraceae bacterium]|nr:hypothetical protein [Oscillospiraceae bacterium]
MILSNLLATSANPKCKQRGIPRSGVPCCLVNGLEMLCISISRARFRICF